MQNIQYFFLFINLLGSMGYSLIAPLYPPMAIKKGVSLSVCGIVLSLFSFTQIIIIINTPYLIAKFGRKKLLNITIVIQSLCTFLYAILESFNGFGFLLLSFVARIFHGIGCGTTSVISYSYTSLLNEGDELKKVMGYMELSFSAGTTIGPLIVSVFYHLGGYKLPFIVCGLLNCLGIVGFYYFTFPEEENEKNDNNNNGKNTSVLPLLLQRDIFLFAFSGMIQLNVQSFFFPTLTNYLMTYFNMSIETSSFYFLLPVIAYFICLQFVAKIIDKLGMKFTVVVGLFVSFIGSLFLAPAPFLPYSIITIAIGLLILGADAALINIPMFLGINETIKQNYQIEEAEAGDKASAIFNLAFNLGDVWSPILGGYITSAFKFEYSSYCAGIMCLLTSWLVYSVYKKQIMDYLSEKKINLKEKMLNLV